MNESSKTSTGGVTLLGLLAIAFIVLRLTDVITWSWWWVLCPIWGPLAIALLALVVYLILVVIAKKKAK